MFRKSFILFILSFVTAFVSYAQKGKVKLDFSGGFELAEQEKGHIKGLSGYGINVDFKYYLHSKLYTLGTVYTSRVSGEQPCEIKIDDKSVAGYETEKLNNTMVGLGIGYDILNKSRHTLFVQAAFGLAIENEEYQKREDSDNNPDNGYFIADSDGRCLR